MVRSLDETLYEPHRLQVRVPVIRDSSDSNPCFNDLMMAGVNVRLKLSKSNQKSRGGGGKSRRSLGLGYQWF